MGNLLDAAATWLLGATCPLCGADAARVCPACADALAAPTPFLVPVPGPGVPVAAAATYREPWPSAVVAFKERGSRGVGRHLGDALALAVAELAASVWPSRLVLVPMPSRPSAVRSRGLDTTLVLARRAVAVLRAAGVECRVDARLTHARAVADQAGLGALERQSNLAGALRARACRDGDARVVVVDDLCTTGASLAEAVRAVRAAGGDVLGCAVVAAAARRDGRVWR